MRDEGCRSGASVRNWIVRIHSGFRSSPALAVSLPSERIAAGDRFHLIRHRALKNNLGPGVVGDFHQAGGQRKSVAKGYKRFLISDFGFRIFHPAAIDHAGNPADELRLRPSCQLVLSNRGALLGKLDGLGHIHVGADQQPDPENHRCDQIRHGPARGEIADRAGPGRNVAGTTFDSKRRWLRVLLRFGGNQNR